MIAREPLVPRRKSFVAACLALMVSGLAACASAAQPAAPPNACALLTAADVGKILGGAPTHTSSPGGQSCQWKSADARRKLAVLTYKSQGPAADMGFQGARMGAQQQEGTAIADEPGIGDRAFSGQVSFGAIFVVLRHGHLFQLQFYTGGKGTAQDVAALRPLAKKAAAGI